MEPSREPFSAETVDPLRIYLTAINETPLLTIEEERTYGQAAREGNAGARDHMIRANLRLVVNIARGFLGKGLDLEDVIEEGNCGLMRAVDKFDPSMGTRFATYASYWIKEGIKRAIMNTGRTIRIPVYLFERVNAWNAMEQKLTIDGRKPSFEEVADALEIPQKKRFEMQEILALLDPCASIQEITLSEESNRSRQRYGQLLSDSRDAHQTANDLEHLRHHLSRLPQDETMVLHKRFGLGNGAEPMLQREVATEIGMDRGAVQRIERNALSKLRMVFGEDMSAVENSDSPRIKESHGTTTDHKTTATPVATHAQSDMETLTA